MVSVTPFTRWWASLLTGPWPEAAGDTLIVLGGEQVEGGIVGRSSFWRAVHAAHIWKSGRIRHILLSGGGEKGQPSVAAQMRQILVVGGVPEGVIELEERSLSTRGNALAVHAQSSSAPGKKLLMTSDFHMVRATRAFRRAGVDVIPCPAPDGHKQYLDWTERWPLALRLTEETGKLAYYAVRGWI